MGTKELSIAQLIAVMDKNRDERRDLEAKIKTLNAEFEEAESKLISKMQAEGTDRVEGRTASAKLSTKTSFSCTGEGGDRNALNAFVKKTGYFEVFTNHIASAACAEILSTNPKLKGVIPGLTRFDKVGVTLTKLRIPKE